MKTSTDKNGNFIVKRVTFLDVCNLDYNMLEVIIALLKHHIEVRDGTPPEWKGTEKDYKEYLTSICEKFREVSDLLRDLSYQNPEELQSKLDEAFSLLSKELFALWI